MRQSMMLAMIAVMVGCGQPTTSTSTSVGTSKQAQNVISPAQGSSPSALVKEAVPSSDTDLLSTPAVAPVTPVAPIVPAVTATPNLSVTQQQVLEVIDVLPGAGNEYEPPEGAKILWVRVALKNPERLPKTLNLSQVRLQPDVPLRGIGFGGAGDEPSVHHILSQGGSGTVRTSGDDVGEVVYDAGQQTVTFTQFPTSLSLIFVVSSPPTNVVITGLFGEMATGK